jgi:hypothetical protein
MKARLIEKSRTVISDTSFFEVVLWHLPSPVPGSTHPFKYRLALIVNGDCVLRYNRLESNFETVDLPRAVDEIDKMRGFPPAGNP